MKRETRNLFLNQSIHGYDLEKNKRAEARPGSCSREAKIIQWKSQLYIGIWKEWFHSCTEVLWILQEFFLIFLNLPIIRVIRLASWECLPRGYKEQTNILQLIVRFLRYWCSWVFYMFALFLYQPTVWAVAISQTRKSWIIKWLNEDVSSKEQAKAWAQMVWFRELSNHCTK